MFSEPVYEIMFEQDEMWFVYKDSEKGGFAILIMDLPLYDA